jgi:lipocalin
MKYLVVIAFAFFAAVNAREFDRPCRNEEVSPNVKTGFIVPAYLGTWYEVMRYEAANQTGLDCVNARYSMNSDGSVQVDNTGYTSDGRLIQFIGRAEVAFPNQVPLPAKLLVTFFPGRKFKQIKF